MDSAPAPAVERAVRILDYLANVEPEAGLSDIAAALDLNKSTCYNILRTLTESSMVVRDARFPVYRLGPKLVELGTASRRNYSYRSQVKREVEPLVQQYGLACLIAQLLPNDAGIVVVDRVTPSGDGVVAAPVGHVYPMTAPAMGRAVLATRPFDEVVQLEAVLAMASANGDLADLSSQLEEVRSNGYAASREEYTEGVNAVATIVRGQDGDVAMILCLVGHTDTFPETAIEKAGNELTETARRLEDSLARTASPFQ